jgi:hypothetical protein
LLSHRTGRLDGGLKNINDNKADSFVAFIMTIDEKIDVILPKINNIPEHFYPLYHSCFGKDDEAQDDNIELLYNYMREKRLIKPGIKQEEYIVLTAFGYDVLTKHNGWVNFLNNKSDNKPKVLFQIDKSVTQKIEIKESTIHGGVSQSSDSSDNKSMSPGITNKKNIIKTISIIIGIIVGLLAIVYYLFEIKKNV